MMSIPRLFAASLFFLSTTLHAAPTAAPDIDTLAASLGQAFVADPAHVGLSIGVTANGAHQDFHFGTIDRKRALLPTAHTLYELASLTKSYTGMLLARAVVDGKLALDDDVRRYLPDSCGNLVLDGRPIRIVDLANHTSGLPKNVPPFLPDATPQKLLDQYGEISREDFIAAICAVRLAVKPGTTFAYSNAGSQLLGVVLERVYGAPYDALVTRLIAAPHGMTETTTIVAAADASRYAMRYDGKGNAMPELTFWRNIPAAGYLKSTIADQLRYLDWNLEETDPVVALAHRVTFGGTDERGDDIALGWFVNRKDGWRLVRHAGGSFGTTSFALLYPDAKVGVVLLANDAGATTEAALAAMADKLAQAMMATRGGARQAVPEAPYRRSNSAAGTGLPSR